MNKLLPLFDWLVKSATFDEDAHPEFEENERKYFETRNRTFVLLSDLVEPDVQIVVAWLRRNHAESFEASRSDIFRALGLDHTKIIFSPPLSEWEYWLWILCEFHWSKVEPLAAWEKVPATDRRVQTSRVARLARDLADALEDERLVPMIGFAQCIDERIAEDVLETQWDMMSDEQRAECNCDSRDKFVYGNPAHKWTATLRLDFLTSLGKQKWPDALRRLARYADAQECVLPREARPKTGNPEARMFARYLADHFFAPIFQRTPNEVIAACVRLKYPDLEIPPDEATIRSWRGTR